MNKTNKKATKTGIMPNNILNLLKIKRIATKGIITKYQRNPFKKSNKISFISSHITKPPRFYI